MKKLSFLIIASLLVVLGLNAQQIDHVTLVYKDFEKAKDYYENLGFSFKYTGMHKTGLINTFVKFKDKSYLEIMSTNEETVDPFTKHYRKLIEKGEGGAYLVLSGIETDDLKSKLKQAGIKCTIDKNQSWDYILFKDKELEHIYFINYHIKINDTEEHLTHKNSTHGIKEVWVEGNQKVAEMLQAIGLSESVTFSDQKYGTVQKFSSKNGDILVISEESTEAHKIRRIVFSDLNNDETLRISF